ncbi:uncharacterized protein LOC132717962 isoform X2 [Ruditapes philippinarum]|uniref:uncharacterized protein LOC132717962 isoform X2 n=1 Tax=Ruditapes philippinarum TaxID=129788 RepID=UPI00295BCF9A|nr:uncharacterized protein LOC132717962 isoform X2 [Ruditapes philippinarum]
MATSSTYGKRMLKASLKLSGSLQKKRFSPDDDAKFFCKAGVDKEGFNVRYISDIKVPLQCTVEKTDALSSTSSIAQDMREDSDTGELDGQATDIYVEHANNTQPLIREDNDTGELDGQATDIYVEHENNTQPLIREDSDTGELDGQATDIHVEHANNTQPLIREDSDTGELDGQATDIHVEHENNTQPLIREDSDTGELDGQATDIYVEHANNTQPLIREDNDTGELDGQATDIHVEHANNTQPLIREDSDTGELDGQATDIYVEHENNTQPLIREDSDTGELDGQATDIYVEHENNTQPLIRDDNTTEIEEEISDNAQPIISARETDNRQKNVKTKKPDRFCIYCKEIVKNGKLKRHITRKHAKVPEVMNILQKENRIQNQFFDEKKKEGISEYNLKLMSENKNPAMRERKPVSEDKLRTCAECKGYYSNKYFYKHKCKSDKPYAIKPALLQKVKKSKMDNDSEFQNILNRFVDGEVGNLIRNNNILQIIGYKHFNMRRHEEGKGDEVRKVVMSDMRELARLYLTFSEIIGEQKAIEEMFTREHLQDLADAIEKMVTRKDKTEKYGLKLLLDAVILRSIKTLMGYFSETMQDEKKKILKVYLEAYRYKSSELYPKARQTCVKQSMKKSRRPENLPCEKNLQKLQDYIHINIEKTVQNFHIKDYKLLRTLVVSRLTLFNARRGEEAPRMLLNEWEAAENNVWLPDEQIQKITDDAEKFLVGQYKLCYILGKGKKFVPVLIPNDIVLGIRLLVKERANYNICENNNFVFATAKRTSHCSGWHALSEVCSAAGVEIPITATGMRHRLSTIYASLNMPADQKKIFLEHMGHEEHINRDNYQCPRGVQAVKVMGRILKTVEQGSSSTLLVDDLSSNPLMDDLSSTLLVDDSSSTALVDDPVDMEQADAQDGDKDQSKALKHILYIFVCVGFIYPRHRYKTIWASICFIYYREKT